MKSSLLFVKRALSVLLAFMVFSAFSVTVYADVWIAPSDKYYNKDVYYILNSSDGRRSMNLFLSNFSEANLENFDPEVTSDLDVLKIVFKHFELNADSYSGVTLSNDGVSGEIITVTQSTVEKAAKNMFNRTFTNHPVGSFQGFQNGNYIFTANQAGSQLKVLSIANYIEYFGDNVYEAYFSVYKADSDIDKYYSYQSFGKELPNGIKRIGEGSAKFNYVGGTGSSAFRLVGYKLSEIDKAELLYTQQNEPVTFITTKPPDPATKVQTTAEQTQPMAENNLSSEETTISGKAVIDEKTDKADLNRLVVITVVVLLASAGASAAIFLIYNRKKKSH
jgi:hypothetical protein